MREFGGERHNDKMCSMTLDYLALCFLLPPALEISAHHLSSQVKQVRTQRGDTIHPGAWLRTSARPGPGAPAYSVSPWAETGRDGAATSPGGTGPAEALRNGLSLKTKSETEQIENC